jgi:hypothetical protein
MRAYRRATEHFRGMNDACYEQKAPHLNVCCLCNKPHRIVHTEARPTGPGGKRFRYAFGNGCWEQFDDLCNGPIYFTGLERLANAVMRPIKRKRSKLPEY